MKTHQYIIQIDAQEAYRQIGVTLADSAIGRESAKCLGERLFKSITNQLLAECMVDATKKQKVKSAVRKSEAPAVGETKTGGSNSHEA